MSQLDSKCRHYIFDQNRLLTLSRRQNTTQERKAWVLPMKSIRGLEDTASNLPSHSESKSLKRISLVSSYQGKKTLLDKVCSMMISPLSKYPLHRAMGL